jgi:Protein of unknown function (DUF3293)
MHPFDIRWQAYRTAIVEAELTPGALASLNGPDAVVSWPFVGAVYAVTGWNPQGVERSQETNDAINRRIAHDVIDAGGRYVSGIGRDPEHSHIESTLIIWNITREEARVLGQRAAQDCIYEITDEHVRLLSCTDNREESWPRRIDG